MLARLIAYVGTLALLAIVGVHLWDQLPEHRRRRAGREGGLERGLALAAGICRRPDQIHPIKQRLMRSSGTPKAAARTSSAGAHPAYGRLPNSKSIAPAAKSSPSRARHGRACRADGRRRAWRELEAAGVIDSKFGNVTLLRLAGGADGARSCLGFVKRLDEPNLQISGWSCQGEALPARRAAISCMLNRLVLLTAGNDPKLAELFARAELKRGSCAAATSAVSADWVTAAQNPASARQAVSPGIPPRRWFL